MTHHTCGYVVRLVDSEHRLSGVEAEYCGKAGRFILRGWWYCAEHYEIEAKQPDQDNTDFADFVQP